MNEHLELLENIINAIPPENDSTDDIKNIINNTSVLQVRRQIQEGIRKQLFIETNSDGEAMATKRLGEKAFLYYISSGNVKMIKQFLLKRKDKNFFDPVDDANVGEVSDNPLEQAISMFVSGITLATRAAIEGGLPEHIAYALSDNYIKYSLPIHDIQMLNDLQDCAVYDFTQQVHQYKYRNCGPIVKKCCEYIERNIHSKITLTELSQLTHKSQGYISECFFNDLKIRPTEYIRKEKLEYATKILHMSDISVSAISDLLAFPSTSAFIQYFKKMYGCTPIEYRNSALDT